MTHQFDQNQRAIQIPVGHSTSGGNGHGAIVQMLAQPGRESDGCAG
jgi:hypothetical protein